MAKKPRLQRLPAPTTAPRVETGAVQFGDDWPGLFLRGDRCMELAAALQSMAEQIGSDRLAMLAVGTLGPTGRLLEMIRRDVIVPRKERAAYEAAADRPRKMRACNPRPFPLPPRKSQ